MPEEKVEEKIEEKVEEPKAKAPAKAPSLEALRRLESRYQSDLAKKNKELTASENRVHDLETKVTELSQRLEEGAFGDDEEAKAAHRKLREAVAELDKRERSLQEKEGQLTAMKKAAAVWALSTEYGVPEEELERAETPEQMHVLALQWALKNQGKAGKEETTTEKPKSERARTAGESGEQRLGGRLNYQDMSTEEFLKKAEQIKQRAMQRAR